MGGTTTKSTPTQTPQSGQAFSGTTGAAGTLSNLGGQYSQNALGMYNTLFGQNGTMTGMMNPSSLNVTSPTGPFAGAYTNDKTQLAKAANQNAQNINSEAAQSGFGAGSPSGMTEQQLNQNNEALANNVGQAFTTETGNSYNAALNNFWNATNLASSAASQQAGIGTGALGTAGNMYSSLYKPSLGSTTSTSEDWMGDLTGLAGKLGSAAMSGGGPASAAALGKGSGGK